MNPLPRKDFYSTREWKAFRTRMLKELEPVCSACNKEVFGSDITLDHILPRSKYPDLEYEPTNIRVLCRQCNGTKRDSTAARMNYYNPRWLGVGG